MWILPKQLHTSPFVPDTEALISDLNEQSQACAQSLLVRSKPSPARTWSLKWKRDSWTQLLSGRILKPSHGPSFTAAWTSSVAAIRASHSAQPASDLAPKTQDTSGRLWQPELLQCDQVSVSLKTSRDISALGYPTCCKTWQDWVTERRGAWRARVNAARLTSGSGSSSWPTVQASEEKANRYRDGSAKGTQIWLTTAVVKDAANWRTPTAEALGTGKHMDSADLKLGARVYNKNGKLMAIDLNRQVEIVARQHGQAAPASSSSLGSRQGLWLTPRANEPDSDPNFAARNADRGAHCHGTLSSQAKGETNWNTPTALMPDRTPEQIVAASKRTKGKWGKAMNTGNLTDQVAMQNWATPNACDHKGATTPEACKQWEFRGQNLPEQTASIMAGKLNPRWVETLMGLPIGWTMPSCTSPQTIAPMSCDSSAMESACPPLSGLGEFSLAS
jgi:hypothetical protein